MKPDAEKSYSDSRKLAAKRAAVLGGPPKRRLPAAIAVVALAAAAAAGGLFHFLRQPAAPVPSAAQSPAGAAAEAVAFPVGLFEDGRAHFFEHAAGPVTIRYFVLKSSDGVLRAAFDACDVCWPAGKGYAQDGDHMICRNCGLRFASVRVNEVKGGCNPAPLERRVENGMLVIRVADILAGRGYFDFARARKG
jgi:uncharacterized membrane protein